MGEMLWSGSPSTADGLLLESPSVEQEFDARRRKGEDVVAVKTAPLEVAAHKAVIEQRAKPALSSSTRWEVKSRHLRGGEQARPGQGLNDVEIPLRSDNGS